MRKRLRAFRKRHELTQREMAMRLGVSRQWVMIVETDASRRIGANLVASFARAFKLKFEQAARICGYDGK